MITVLYSFQAFFFDRLCNNTILLIYSNPKILARDNNSFRLQIKETLKIKEYCAHNSLNDNLGSLKFSLW